jgi:hypothetical protein
MSRGPEANFWNTIRKNLPKNCYAWRVENRVTAGMPDVYAIWEGLPIWLELKVIKANAVSLSPQQVAWHTAHSHVGGLSFILVKHLSSGTLFLFEGHRGREISSEGLGSGADFECSGFGDLFGAIKDRVSGHYRGKFGDSGM